MRQVAVKNGPRRASGIALVALATVCGAALWLPGGGSTQPPPPGLSPQPALGAADPDTELMGAGGSEPGEAWGYRQLPLTVGSVRAGDHEVPIAPPRQPGSTDPQLAFVRYTHAVPGAEALAEDLGQGRVAVTAYDDGDATHLLFGVLGRPAEDAVAHFDGETWSREPIILPPGSNTDFKIVALAAAGAGDAWLLARLDPDLGRGLALFEREDGGAGPRWVERDLGAPVFAA